MQEKGALEKLTIFSFTDASLSKPKNSFVAMFNPSTFSVNSSNAFDEQKPLQKGQGDQKLLHREARKLSFELFFDGTAASPLSGNNGADISKFGLKGGGQQFIPANQLKTDRDLAVTEAVNNFMETTYTIDSQQHRPLFLAIIWGTFLFPCVLESANVTYSLFQRDGKPLRAKISVSAKEHITDEKLNQTLNLKSADLTHSRIVIAGDTLPNLAEEIYGDESLYIRLAEANNLHNYRKLKPGTQLIFPPIEKLKSR